MTSGPRSSWWRGTEELPRWALIKYENDDNDEGALIFLLSDDTLKNWRRACLAFWSLWAVWQNQSLPTQHLHLCRCCRCYHYCHFVIYAGTKNIIHHIPICVHSFPFIFFYCRPTFVVLWSVCLAGGKASMGLELAWSVLCTLVSTLYSILWPRQ